MENTVNMVETIKPFTEALTASITPGQIVALLAAVIGVGMAGLQKIK